MSDQQATELAAAFTSWQGVTQRLEETHRRLRDEVARLTRELELKNRQLARKNRLADLGEVAAHVAHEIRNPLVAVQLYISLLSRSLPADEDCGNLVRKIQAALTGHLVFSTLHTNDAPAAITRLIDMGVKPFLVASSIQAVMAQRLIRVLCTECKALDDKPDPKYMRLTSISPDEAAGNVYKPMGCAVCSGTGFKGRKAIFEMMVMNTQVRDLAFKLAPLVEIRQAAIANGMRTLVEDGKIKILNGTTSPGEVARMAQVESDRVEEESAA